MEYFFSNYGLEIVVGMIISVLVFIFLRVLYFGYLKKDIKNNWYLVNATDIVVGRLAAYISNVLRGKNKAMYNPNQDNGDFVIVTNPSVVQT